jgi:hypothetical protein
MATALKYEGQLALLTKGGVKPNLFNTLDSTDVLGSYCLLKYIKENITLLFCDLFT